MAIYQIALASLLSTALAISAHIKAFVVLPLLHAIFSWSGLFQVATSCSDETCPGSQMTKTAAAWANIGYLTHSDMLYFINSTGFGAWAPLLYACAAVAALTGVALNAPLRGYTWFLLGPAIYSFLVGSTMQVQGVDWVVGNRPQKLDSMWRDAEPGMKNTAAVAERRVVSVPDKNGPQGMYEVAMPMVFLDELFSATSNLMIQWLGLGRLDGDGSSESNLAGFAKGEDVPWFLLSSEKWGMVENITATTARDPDFRDALVNFLASECGEKFKSIVVSGNYIAATQSRGEDSVKYVLLGGDSGSYDRSLKDYKLNGTFIPAPRSLLRMFGTAPNDEGTFANFAPLYSENGDFRKGDHSMVSCTEFLYTIIQQIRYEAGGAFWQLVRSSPERMNKEEFLKNLFYGWDIRKDKQAQYASEAEINAFTKHLMAAFLLRNELLYAPQITEVNQRFAPSEQAKSYSEAYVRTSGSKSKSQELYNWGVMMPSLQGILVYFLLIAYPFVAMVTVLPGYWKAFMTWVSFFAWVKLWDVGFAVVMVLERSVWAMMGNNARLGRVSNILIKAAEESGGIGVGCGEPDSADKLCPVPRVCSLSDLDADNCIGGVDQTPDKALRLFDKLLLVTTAADLDVSNGYYIYIMGALYMAVPAVTGQLVLGAKAGASSMINSAIGGVAGEAGRAAMTGYQQATVNSVMTNQGSMAQAAYAKAMRKDNLAGSLWGSMNAPLEQEAVAAEAQMEKSRLAATAGIRKASAESLENRARGIFGLADNLGDPFLKVAGREMAKANDQTGFPKRLGEFLANETQNTGGNGANGQGGGSGLKPYIDGARGLTTAWGAALHDNRINAEESSIRGGMVQEGISAAAGLRRSGQSAEAGYQKSAADYEAQMAVWEAKNAFASHVASMAGIAGMNAGSLSAGSKPAEFVGMSRAGELSVAERNPNKRSDDDGERSWIFSKGGNVAAASSFANTISGSRAQAIQDNYSGWAAGKEMSVGSGESAKQVAGLPEFSYNPLWDSSQKGQPMTKLRMEADKNQNLPERHVDIPTHWSMMIPRPKPPPQ